MDMRNYRKLVVEELSLSEEQDEEKQTGNIDGRSKHRYDHHPEYMQYQDEGCEVSPSCLRCPLPRCKYDDPTWLRRKAKALRDREVRRMRKEKGLNQGELARCFGLSRRTVNRILREEH